MIDYNEKAANRITDDLCIQTGLDITHKTREQRNVFLRTFLYKRLKNHNFMNDRQISYFLKTRGIKIDRSSVFAALTKSDLYYMSFAEYRTLHDVFFKVPNLYRKKIRKEEKSNIINSKKAKLYSLINNLDESKIKEVEEMLELKVKSFQWKSNIN